MERTLIVIKPDAVSRNLVGEILNRFEKDGFAIEAMTMLQFDSQMVRKLYGQHEGKSFYESNREFITSGPSVLVVLRGENAINRVREMIGKLGLPGTVRGDYGTVNPKNAIHASDGPVAALTEIRRFFG